MPLLTDHGAMLGTLAFCKQCKSEGSSLLSDARCIPQEEADSTRIRMQTAITGIWCCWLKTIPVP